jgi:hypothetical protein
MCVCVKCEASKLGKASPQADHAWSRSAFGDVFPGFKPAEIASALDSACQQH